MRALGPRCSSSPSSLLSSPPQSQPPSSSPSRGAPACVPPSSLLCSPSASPVPHHHPSCSFLPSLHSRHRLHQVRAFAHPPCWGHQSSSGRLIRGCLSL